MPDEPLARPIDPESAVPLLTARGLACRRGDRLLFDALSVSLAPGDLVWLRGANGSGKTSLLRILAGVARAEAGIVERDVAPERRPLFVAHANALKEDLTVLEALRFNAALHGRATDDAALAGALRTLGIQARRHAPIRTLSQGQRRRVALARLCLSGDVPVWLLDEPFDALDAEGVVATVALLDAHARRGGAALFTSHLPVSPPTVALRETSLAAPSPAKPLPA